MCGIAGFLSTHGIEPARARTLLDTFNEILKHRGPDGSGTWMDAAPVVGLAHRRLSILDLSPQGAQPMASPSGNVITYNGEIYNFLELREELGAHGFRSTSDTEVILKAYERWGAACVEKLRGMFAFALWDAKKERLFVARDRFGIKPFYYLSQNGMFYFASEAKALTPLLDEVATDIDGLRDYFTFQLCLGAKTLFRGIKQLEPATCGYVRRDGTIEVTRYWEVHYDLDWDHTEEYFVRKTREAVEQSVAMHLRSDVEVGSYVSGGIDSSLVALLARRVRPNDRMQSFTGRFGEFPKFDESHYSRLVAEASGIQPHEQDITEADFVENIAKVVYHLDYPVAGPGSFPQYMVSRLARERVKVVLGGQGGDEVFGGYTRYLIAYFEQCIRGAIDGTMSDGKYVVTYESIIPNLRSLANYKPLIQEFWADGIFDARDKRYFRLINRANTSKGTVNWKLFNGTSSFDEFQKIYWGENVGKEAYFDSMTHFDFKTLLPALLQVEDRMSMAHSLESRVPLVDHHVVELAATIPANVKFQNGELKRLLRHTFADVLPAAVLDRKDKMGFPVPLKPWLGRGGAFREFLLDTFRSSKAKSRPYLAETFDIESIIRDEGEFSRNLWGLLSLELWQQQFHDRHGIN